MFRSLAEPATILLDTLSHLGLIFAAKSVLSLFDLTGCSPELCFGFSCVLSFFRYLTWKLCPLSLVQCQEQMNNLHLHFCFRSRTSRSAPPFHCLLLCLFGHDSMKCVCSFACSLMISCREC